MSHRVISSLTPLIPGVTHLPLILPPLTCGMRPLSLLSSTFERSTLVLFFFQSSNRRRGDPHQSSYAFASPSPFFLILYSLTGFALLFLPFWRFCARLRILALGVCFCPTKEPSFLTSSRDCCLVYNSSLSWMGRLFHDRPRKLFFTDGHGRGLVFRALPLVISVSDRGPPLRAFSAVRMVRLADRFPSHFSWTCRWSLFQEQFAVPSRGRTICETVCYVDLIWRQSSLNLGRTLTFPALRLSWAPVRLSNRDIRPFCKFSALAAIIPRHR